MTAWVWALGRMLGLGDIAGMRPSLTLAVIGIASKFDLGPGVSSPFFWLDHWFTILIFVVLAIFESSFDKIPKCDRLQGRLTMPYRLVAGGIAGASVIPFGWQGIVAGAAVGAGMAWVSLLHQEALAAAHGVQRRRAESAEPVGGPRGAARHGRDARVLAVRLRDRRLQGHRVLGARYRRKAKYRKLKDGGSGR